MTKLLALDQASITSGWSIWEDGQLKAYGKFTFNDSDIGVRLLNIRNRVKELIVENEINEDFLNSVKENHPGLYIDEVDVKKMLENNDFSIVKTW